MKLFATFPMLLLAGAPVPNGDRQPLPENCPINVDPEVCFTFCGTLACWEYPNNWPKLRQEVDSLLTRSRRGAELTDDELDCYFTDTVANCNAMLDNDFQVSN